MTYLKGILFCMLFMISTLVKADVECVEKAYTVKQGDTLSGVLSREGSLRKEQLYGHSGDEGVVKENKEINPQVKNWNKLMPKDEIKIKYPERRHKRHSGVTNKEPVCATTTAPVNTTMEPTVVPVVAVNSEKDYFIEHRFGLGLGFGFDTETQIVQVVRSDRTVIFPIFLYDLRYRATRDLKAASWEYRFLGQLQHTLAVSNTALPLDGQFEIGFGRYSLFKYGRTRFNPNIDMNFEFNSNVTADVDGNKSARRKSILWIGIKPEFVSYINKTMIEYYPFIYKSLYGRSLDERMGGWRFGLKSNVGIALDNALFGSVEYNYETLNNKSDDVNVASHKILLGVGYRI